MVKNTKLRVHRSRASMVTPRLLHSNLTQDEYLLINSMMMKKKGRRLDFFRFFNRSTSIGGIINSYLSCTSELEDHSIHLLFSANRWELVPKILSTLESGTSIIIDRYAFSGVAFSGAKKNISLEWCKNSDIGLPRPDLVLFLDLSHEEAQRRAQFGEERYEKEEFQKKVYANYQLLKDETWKVIDANKSIEELQEVLSQEVIKTIDGVKENTIQKLWVNQE
ncbi:unnamed protein product, partial [Meganyctiphanes norvegica]